MVRRGVGLIIMLPIFALAGCETARSENPLSPTVAGPIAGVEIQAPKGYTPLPASQIAVEQQPVTLTVDNAATNGVRPVSYLFEISTDSSFVTKVFTQSGIEAGKSGRTSLTLSQSLTPERLYYWRSKADDGANASAYSEVMTFKIYTPVVIRPPSLKTPADGSTVSSRKPTFTVTNSQRSGPAGEVQYVFEVGTDAALSNKTISVLVNEGSSQTTYTATSDLAYATRYYWRVKATDPGHESSYSNTQSFITPDAPIVITPPGGGGPGNPSAVDMINMRAASIVNSPGDLGSWPATTALSLVEWRRDGIHVEFSKQSGAGRWPDIFPPGWDEPLQYTLGMCLNINGWHCSAVVQFWYGLDRSGGPPELIAENWFYAGRWAPMTGYQPAVGETIGMFVCAGDCRNGGSVSLVKERTNVVLLQFPGPQGGTFRY